MQKTICFDGPYAWCQYLPLPSVVRVKTECDPLRPAGFASD